jgi:hypothetical protein
VGRFPFSRSTARHSPPRALAIFPARFEHELREVIRSCRPAAAKPLHKQVYFAAEEA